MPWQTAHAATPRQPRSGRARRWRKTRPASGRGHGWPPSRQSGDDERRVSDRRIGIGSDAVFPSTASPSGETARRDPARAVGPGDACRRVGSDGVRLQSRRSADAGACSRSAACGPATRRRPARLWPAGRSLCRRVGLARTRGRVGICRAAAGTGLRQQSRPLLQLVPPR